MFIACFWKKSADISEYRILKPTNICISIGLQNPLSVGLYSLSWGNSFLFDNLYKDIYVVVKQTTGWSYCKKCRTLSRSFSKCEVKVLLVRKPDFGFGFELAMFRWRWGTFTEGKHVGFQLWHAMENWRWGFFCLKAQTTYISKERLQLMVIIRDHESRFADVLSLLDFCLYQHQIRVWGCE